MNYEELAGMVYPTFEIIESRGILPCVRLPLKYKELVQKFYSQGRREDVEEYARSLEKMLKLTMDFDLPIKTQWSTEEGLTHISIGPNGGFYLQNTGWPSFQEHNLGTITGFPAGMIATKYVSELLKSN